MNERKWNKIVLVLTYTYTLTLGIVIPMSHEKMTIP